MDFTKVDPSKDGKENILVLTDVFNKFSQVFVTPNQKAITVAKTLVDKCLMFMAFLHKHTVIKAGALIMKSCHIYVPCTGLSNQPPHHTICMEMPQGKIEPYINWPVQIITQGEEEQLAITSTIAVICI